MNHFTFFDFHELNKEEKALNKLFNKNKPEENTLSPSKISIDKILNYSKALSIRKSNQLGTIEHLLN